MVRSIFTTLTLTPLLQEASRLQAEEAEARRDPEKEADLARRQEESLENPTGEMSR